MNSKEQNNFNPETKKETKELQELGDQHRERLQENLERAAEQSPEKVEDVRQEAMEKALAHEKQTTPESTEEESPVERRPNGPRSKLETEASFNATMTEVRTQMSAPSRTFSKVIHNKAVEKVSEVTGNTVARPDAILSGAIFAFALTLGTYLIAKNFGYPLSGFEAIAAFILGWILGIVYDFLKVMVTGRK